MLAEVPIPNVQELQQDVIELLGEISDLMNRASTALSSDRVDNKYADFEKQIRNETTKVENLELRMAIVAPMKAGKSTIVNAVAGQDILPSRNSAMTTLPTEIIFDAGLDKPVLTLSDSVLSVFQDTLDSLREKINELGLETVKERLATYPHLQEMPELIQVKVSESIPRKSEGHKDIALTLTSLNDIVRLCSILDPQSDPIQYLEDVPRIRTPFWRSLEDNNQAKTQGKLVIVDTPGPNEAGENLRLQAVVAEQLEKSSIVLIVLDFTQLKNEAAEKVKQDVQRVIDIRGKENLYVLVNKVDQRRDGDMNPQQVKDFVAAEFKIGEAGDKNRVFEISARRAFTSANFLMELQQFPDKKVAEMKTVRALAEEVFGIDWEEELEDATVDDLKIKAEKLWKKSGFEPFLNGAIAALMKEAAPRCMKSTLQIANHYLVELNNDVQLRSSAINQDDEKLQQEVDLLEQDLKSLEECHHRLKEVDRIKVDLENQLDKILEKLETDAQASLEAYFTEERYQRADFIQKGGMGFQSFFNWASNKFGHVEIKSQNQGVIEFPTLRQAEDFSEEAIASVKRNIIEPFLEKVRIEFHKNIESARHNLTDFLEYETQPIIKRAQTRLNENFNINLSLPDLKINYFPVYEPKAKINHESRWVDQGYETKVVQKRSFFHFLGMVPKKKTIRVKLPDAKEQYYTVSLREISDKSNRLIDESIKNIKQKVYQYLDDDFKQRINNLFNNLDNYLNNYCDTLKQAQEDQKIEVDQKSQLISNLDALFSESGKKLRETEIYLQRTNNLMEDK
ncbi:dynamin family protein [Rivularia sp. UHCC 0363]|uniref:dynamin family protein n=1 Tax=Rivularia sp. UHCC 0363 TaxID=3110244 RepID=UPI002B2194AC|nr:dynamin family protein [Rivularia sp. UHCC 0363]MEA5593745.1 dynamin family protein [Rivularia sp. UHCC 0363]